MVQLVQDLRRIVGVPLKPNLCDTDFVNASLALFIATLIVVGAIVIVNITIFQLRIHERARRRRSRIAAQRLRPRIHTPSPSLLQPPR